MYSQGQLKNERPLVQSEMDGKGRSEMNTRAFSTPARLFGDYSARLSATLQGFDWAPVERLTYDLLDCWQTGRQVFFAGQRRQWRKRQPPRQRFSLCAIEDPGLRFCASIRSRPIHPYSRVSP